MGSGNETLMATWQATMASSRAGGWREGLANALSRDWRGRGTRELSFSSEHKAKTHHRYATRIRGGMVLLEKEVWDVAPSSKVTVQRLRTSTVDNLSSIQTAEVLVMCIMGITCA